MRNKNKLKAELLSYALDKIKEGTCDHCYMIDVVNEIFNREYYIIGHYSAEQWIIENFESVFSAIQEVFEYELENFGEICTKEINAESICNMLVYIHGQDFLYEIIGELDGLDGCMRDTCYASENEENENHTKKDEIIRLLEKELSND